MSLEQQPVSYTHLDVYKRQYKSLELLYRPACVRMRLVPKRGCSHVHRISKGQDGRADSQGHHGWEMEGCRPVKIRNSGVFQLIDLCSSLVAELVNGMGSRSGRPILRSEIDAPEMGAGRKKFDTDTHPFFGSIAKINHSAFLLFLSHGIN